ncbi:tautomerase family protein [Rhizobium sp. NTR19]|uniref:Tautomerase family protein n=1 Tax=Neorhizobium turbinariae TaxID=2937795 RepID=A0ABT0IXI7_9HYPH|nr:tautomerase family protein [Neorhizobium turbinariae]MCK8782606.1 tautomerase family protein [Neorhizobium turbinariae]
MPIVRLDVVRGRSPEELNELLDTVHEAVVDSLGVPISDRYEILTEHLPSQIVALDTGLGFKRSESIVIVQITTRPRSLGEKKSLYNRLAELLAERCGLPSSDLVVALVENTDADWSFGGGEAQFLTGALPT